ncbi:MAG: hypothetical protein VB078_00485 [Clostridiaceae bacterium]|nr:hypothetical protein [Clostridiaceae bacterium]
MPITKPQLPPKAGYVEVEENGQRVYKPTQSEERIASLEENKAAQNDIESLLVDQEYQITLIKLGVTNDAV